jgi:hypothetical protein
MLKKLRHPIVWGILFGCFSVGFGFTVCDANPRVDYIGTVNAVHQRENVFEWDWLYSDRGVKLFMFLLVLIGIVEVGLFFRQLRITRQCVKDLERATKAARQTTNEKAAALAELSHYLERELSTSITDTLDAA